MLIPEQGAAFIIITSGSFVGTIPAVASCILKIGMVIVISIVLVGLTVNNNDVKCPLLVEPTR
jgi:hypothetical protein